MHPLTTALHLAGALAATGTAWLAIMLAGALNALTQPDDQEPQP